MRVNKYSGAILLHSIIVAGFAVIVLVCIIAYTRLSIVNQIYSLSANCDASMVSF